MNPLEQPQTFASRRKEFRVYQLNLAAALELAGHPCLRVDVDAMQDRCRYIFPREAEGVFAHLQATVARLKERERAARGVLLEREVGQ
jgi:hypothetical protein